MALTEDFNLTHTLYVYQFTHLAGNNSFYYNAHTDYLMCIPVLSLVFFAMK